jgi:DNA sulfur modification protein DndC
MDEVDVLMSSSNDSLALLLNLSGGKDSTRMLGFIRQHFPTVKTYAVMADTGFEHVKPVPAVNWCRQLAAGFGLPLTVVRNPNKTYLEMVRRRGMFPSAQFRQCTSDLKRGPIQKFLRTIPEKIVINCMGMRAEESPRRARQSPWTLDMVMSKNGRTVYNWLPIFGDDGGLCCINSKTDRRHTSCRALRACSTTICCGQKS